MLKISVQSILSDLILKALSYRLIVLKEGHEAILKNSNMASGDEGLIVKKCIGLNSLVLLSLVRQSKSFRNIYLALGRQNYYCKDVRDHH